MQTSADKETKFEPIFPQKLEAFNDRECVIESVGMAALIFVSQHCKRVSFHVSSSRKTGITVKTQHVNKRTFPMLIIDCNSSHQLTKYQKINIHRCVILPSHASWKIEISMVHDTFYLRKELDTQNTESWNTQCHKAFSNQTGRWSITRFSC